MAEATKVSFVGTSIASGKSEFAARLSVIDPNLAAAVRNGSVQVVDAAIYTARDLKTDSTIELMQSADDKSVGISNINKRQLEANTYFLVTGIQLLESSAAVGSTALGALTYETINTASHPVNVLNGEFELKVGDKILIPRSSCNIFATGANAEKPGYFKLDCPKLISPLTDIIPQLWLPTAYTSSDNHAVKIILHGVKTNKA